MEANISLPFLHPKRIGAVLIAKHKLAEGGPVADVEREEGGAHPGVLQACESLISAINMKDASAVALMLEHIFEMLDGGDADPEPNHMEGRE